jgi:hypothetical protein
LKLKYIIHSQAYGAMVSQTHLVEKTLDSNGLIDHSTGVYREKNTDSNSLTDPSHTVNSSIISFVVRKKNSLTC